MTTEQAFMAEIMARPDEDGPRLVFADWLQEKGDWRGELLRLQVAMRRDSPDPDRYRRHEELMARFRSNKARYCWWANTRFLPSFEITIPQGATIQKIIETRRPAYTWISSWITNRRFPI